MAAPGFAVRTYDNDLFSKLSSFTASYEIIIIFILHNYVSKKVTEKEVPNAHLLRETIIDSSLGTIFLYNE